MYIYIYNNGRQTKHAERNFKKKKIKSYEERGPGRDEMRVCVIYIYLGNFRLRWAWREIRFRGSFYARPNRFHTVWGEGGRSVSTIVRRAFRRRMKNRVGRSRRGRRFRNLVRPTDKRRITTNARCVLRDIGRERTRHSGGCSGGDGGKRQTGLCGP